MGDGTFFSPALPPSGLCACVCLVSLFCSFICFLHTTKRTTDPNIEHHLCSLTCFLHMLPSQRQENHKPDIEPNDQNKVFTLKIYESDHSKIGASSTVLL